RSSLPENPELSIVSAPCNTHNKISVHPADLPKFLRLGPSSEYILGNRQSDPGYPFILAEVKKPDARTDSLDQDTRKLPQMMKIAIDRICSANIASPTVIGFLIQGIYIFNERFA
ncbi:hypothetical protein BGX27_004347, partial [Mortierella sp. AM989]